MSRAGLLSAIVTVAALGAGVGPVNARAVDSHASATRLKVTLIEFKLTPSVKRAAPGRVTFVVRNAGKIAHEFVVLKTKTPAGKLPTKGARAVETGRVGKIGPLGPGKTKSLTLTLKRGHYALLCNLPGHYRAGQFADFVAR